ncbi:MAG: acylphosphatase [Deltaproteobacteria bacterium]|nr:acylphosphatase [Deltaproteobacteria bacterium]
MKKRAHIVVQGIVQGVFFRASTVDVAEAHGVYGWVKNNPDGTVEAVLEGEEKAVKEVIAWCRVGPPRARVDDVTVEWEPFKNEFDDFRAVTRHNSY